VWEYHSTEVVASHRVSQLKEVLFYEGNDYKNNGAAPRTRSVESGYLSDVITSKKSSLQRFLMKNSLLAALADVKISNAIEKRAFRSNIQKTEQLLLELKRALKEEEIPLVVIFIPDQDPFFYSRSSLLRAYDKWISGIDVWQARERIQSFASEHDIPFYMLSSKFEAGKQTRAMRLEDTHFNSRGHEEAAEEMLLFLRSKEAFL